LTTFALRVDLTALGRASPISAEVEDILMKMKIFLSWSGPHSREVAKALDWWLPQVIQAVKPFFSPDIEKGTRWSAQLDAALADARFGIVCLTPDNLDSTWIHYETGALNKSQDALVWTFLHGLTPKKVPPPLDKFEHTIAERDDVLRLLKSINERLRMVGGEPLSEGYLATAFNTYWPELEQKLLAAEAIGGLVNSMSLYDKIEEFDKFLALGMKKLHDPLTDENLQYRLGSSRDIKVLKTWFPESADIENGLEEAIKQKAVVRLLLCKPGSVLLEQRSLGAVEKPRWGSFKVYDAVKKIRGWVKTTPGADVQIAIYDSWPGCPVIWYDNEILMGFYFRGKSSPAWPWISVEKGTRLAGILDDQFKNLWGEAVECLVTPDELESWLERNKDFNSL
jgi:hypothetical protein